MQDGTSAEQRNMKKRENVRKGEDFAQKRDTFRKGRENADEENEKGFRMCKEKVNIRSSGSLLFLK